MKKQWQVGLLAVSVTAAVFSLTTSALAQSLRGVDQSHTVTLFAVNKYHGTRSACLKLLSVPRDCPLRYGSLYAGDDWDWFESSAVGTSRTVVKDLGLFNWNDAFSVPVIEPLPKLKPGEQRHVSIDTSGADGADGALGLRGEDAPEPDGVVRPRQMPRPEAGLEPLTFSRSKRAGKPKIDPIYAKAIVGHMYAIHVVNDVDDFYTLIHVDAVERGDRCIVSWRVVPAPETTNHRK